MTADYEARLKELFGELKLVPYRASIENLATDRQLTKHETENIFDENRYFVYVSAKNERRPYKRRIFIHMNSYYLPDFVRGMTDTVKDIWINAKEYYRKFVLRHEKIHVAHPEWPEELVREFDEFYEPFLPDVEWVYV